MRSPFSEENGMQSDPFEGNALRWMVEVAKARNDNPQAKNVSLKFTRRTLEMWIEAAEEDLREPAR